MSSKSLDRWAWSLRGNAQTGLDVFRIYYELNIANNLVCHWVFEHKIETCYHSNWENRFQATVSLPLLAQPVPNNYLTSSRDFFLNPHWRTKMVLFKTDNCTGLAGVKDGERGPKLEPEVWYFQM